MKENLILQEKFVPDYVIEELQGVIFKFRKHKTRQLSQYDDDTQIKGIKRNDPEAFQNEYSISKYPGDVKEAEDMEWNRTLYEIYLHKKKIKIDWLFFNIYKEPYIIEKYGMGVPLLFTQIKMVLAVLYLLFFINLYSGFAQFDQCVSQLGCFVFIGGGFGIIDITTLPSNIMQSLSFLIWLSFGYFLRIYINRICDEDDNFRQNEIDKSNQLMLKYFLKGLSKEQIEERLTEKVNEYCDRMKIGLPPDFRINLTEVTPITNFYKINQKTKQVNQLYMKILKMVQKIDPILMKPQERVSTKKPKMCNQFDYQQNPQNDNVGDEQVPVIESKSVLDISEKQSQTQVNKEGNEENRESINNDNQNESSHSLIENNQQNDEIQNGLTFEGEDQDDMRRQSYGGDLKKQEIRKQNDLLVDNGISVIEDNQKEQEGVYSINHQEEDSIVNRILTEQEDYFDQMISFKQCEEFLMRQNKKIDKLIKVLKLYQVKKSQLEDEYQSREILSSSYIVKCQSIQQKHLLQMFLEPPNQFKSFFQKGKYIFRNKDSDYSLDRYFPTNSTHLNVNWQTIGIELQTKLQKQLFVQIIGTFQFILSFCLLCYLYILKLSNDLEGQTESSFSVWLWKAGLALSQSVFYLVCEKIYDLYSFHMVTSLKSKKISLQIHNMFFFYSLSYILLPLLSIFFLSFLAYFAYIGFNQSLNNQKMLQEYKPFKLFLSNFLIAVFLFSLKACFPLKLIKSKLTQEYYRKANRYMKKTQLELNKIYKRVKFRISDNILALFNVLTISIPFTFCKPGLLIIPILLITLMYFAIKYQYLMVMRPIYYCKTSHKGTSHQFATYIQRIAFFSYLFFTSDIYILISTLSFYFFLYLSEICIEVYYQQNFQNIKATRAQFINQLESHLSTQSIKKLNKQLYHAVEQYQAGSRNQTTNSLSSSQFTPFYFNQKHIQNTMNLETTQQQDIGEISEQSSSLLQNNISFIKKYLYSYEQEYTKYKYILEQQKLFHTSKN